MKSSKRFASEAQAVSYLQGQGVEVDLNRKFIGKEPVRGLKACSAIDFLVIYKKYRR